MKHRRRKSSPLHRRRGAIFVTALGIIVILSGLVLVFAQSMRTESLASANRLSYVQADSVEQGAEQWVLAQIESYPADSVTITQVPAEALQVGNGYFWVLTPNPTTDQTYDFGITDEAGKLNLNSVSSKQLMLLPNMEQDIADSIVTWRSTGAVSSSGDGADSDYYETLPEPYDAKHSPFETVEELMLVKDVTTDLLYGLDVNHDGVVTDAERSGNTASSINFNTPNGTNRGIFNDLTVYSKEPNTTISGGARINVNTGNNALQKLFTSKLSASRATAITTKLAPIYRAARGRPIFPDLGRFYIASGMTADEFSQVADSLTASTAKTMTGLVNVNTAPVEVLMTLPNMDESSANALVAFRANAANPGSIGWIFKAMDATKALGIINSVTARSFIYSADIVAVSGDGRSFKRVRIVVDSQKLPAKIVYRKDLTSLGWPLPPEVRQTMRAGQPPPIGLSGSGMNLGH